MSDSATLQTVACQASLPSPTPEVYSDSCPLSQWCHPTISSSAVPFSSCLQPFPASGSFLKSQLFASGGQSVGALASALVFPVSIQGWFLFDWFDLLGTLKSLLQHHSSKASILPQSAFFMVQPSYGSLFFNTLPTFVTAFLPRSNRLSISWLCLLSAVILEPKKIKSVTVSIFSLPICHDVMGPDAMIFVFWILSFKLAFLTLLLHLHQKAF